MLRWCPVVTKVRKLDYLRVSRGTEAHAFYVVRTCFMGCIGRLLHILAYSEQQVDLHRWIGCRLLQPHLVNHRSDHAWNTDPWQLVVDYLPPGMDCELAEMIKLMSPSGSISQGIIWILVTVAVYTVPLVRSSFFVNIRIWTCSLIYTGSKDTSLAGLELYVR